MMSPSMLTPEQDIALRGYIERLLRDRDRKLPIKLTSLLIGEDGFEKIRISHRLAMKEYMLEYDSTDPFPMIQRIQIHRAVIDLEYLPILDCVEGRNDRARLLQCHLKSSDIILLVYSVTNRRTLKHLEDVHEELFSAANTTTLRGEENVPSNSELVRGKPLWVLANKIDLPAERWEVTTQEGQEFAESIGARFRSVSALTGEGLQDDFAVEMVSRLFFLERERERNEKEKKEAREGDERKRKEEAATASKKKWGRWPFGAKLREMVYARREAKKLAAVSTT